MVSSSEITTDVQNIIRELGDRVRIRYFGASYPGGGSYFDDTVTLAQSGNDFWTSGLITPVNALRGSTDAVLLEEGRVLHSDSVLYVAGTVGTSGIWRVGLGSPIRQEYGVVDAGITGWGVNGSNSLKVLYVRVLTTGSLGYE